MDNLYYSDKNSYDTEPAGYQEILQRLEDLNEMLRKERKQHKRSKKKLEKKLKKYKKPKKGKAKRKTDFLNAALESLPAALNLADTVLKKR